MNKQTSLSRLKNLQRAVALGACAAALTACGGGGGGFEVVPPPMVNPQLAMQGFWSGSIAPAPDAATAASAIVMPNGTTWIVYERTTATTPATVVPTAVANIPLTGTAVSATDATVAGSGSYYRLSDGVRSAVSASGTASTAGAGSLKGTATVGTNAASTFNWTKASTSFTTQAQQSAVTGTWRGTAGGNTVQITWTISAAGAVTGTSTTGCNYTGTVTPATGVAVYNVAVSEDCAGTVKAMAGVATVAATAPQLRVVFTADAGAQGGLISFTKQ